GSAYVVVPVSVAVREGRLVCARWCVDPGGRPARSPRALQWQRSGDGDGRGHVTFEDWDALIAEHDQLGVGSGIQDELREALRPVLGRWPNPRLVGRDADAWDDDLRDEV